MVINHKHNTVHMLIALATIVLSAATAQFSASTLMSPEERLIYEIKQCKRVLVRNSKLPEEFKSPGPDTPFVQELRDGMHALLVRKMVDNSRQLASLTNCDITIYQAIAPIEATVYTRGLDTSTAKSAKAFRDLINDSRSQGAPVTLEGECSKVIGYIHKLLHGRQGGDTEVVIAELRVNSQLLAAYFDACYGPKCNAVQVSSDQQPDGTHIATIKVSKDFRLCFQVPWGIEQFANDDPSKHAIKLKPISGISIYAIRKTPDTRR